MDTWSVLKLAFLLSVALGIITVVASLVLWLHAGSDRSLPGHQRAALHARWQCGGSGRGEDPCRSATRRCSPP
ncbi:DUF3566 domain-containing protein [Kocuria rhizophila]|nr:DUF3566 domain-containing protein [Kocuria rhizophila]